MKRWSSLLLDANIIIALFKQGCCREHSRPRRRVGPLTRGGESSRAGRCHWLAASCEGGPEIKA
jgi:hypothetical protein